MVGEMAPYHFMSTEIWSEPVEERGVVQIWGDAQGVPKLLLEMSLAAAEDLSDQMARHAKRGREAARV